MILSAIIIIGACFVGFLAAKLICGIFSLLADIFNLFFG